MFCVLTCVLLWCVHLVLCGLNHNPLVLLVLCGLVVHLLVHLLVHLVRSGLTSFLLVLMALCGPGCLVVFLVLCGLVVHLCFGPVLVVCVVPCVQVVLVVFVGCVVEGHC